MSHSRFRRTSGLYLDMHGLIFETSICYWQDQPGSVCVCIHTRPRPPLTAERGHMRANDPPTLARVRVCVPVRVVCRARASAGTPSTPLRDEGARAAGLRASALCGVSVSHWAPRRARERRDAPHRWPTHDSSRRDHRRLAASPCFPLARALVCVAPRHYEVRFPPRGARKRGRYRERSGPTHDTSRQDHRRLAGLCVPLARASSITRLPRPPTTQHAQALESESV